MVERTGIKEQEAGKSPASNELFRYINRYLGLSAYLWGNTCRHFGNKTGFQYSYQRAVAWYTYASQKDPNLVEARRDRGILLWREMDRCKDAIAEFDALLQENAGDAAAWLNRALAYQKIGDYPKALEDVENYLKLPVQDVEYWHYASRMMKMLRQLLEERPTDSLPAAELDPV